MDLNITFKVDPQLSMDDRVDEMFRRFSEAKSVAGNRIRFRSIQELQTGNNFTSVQQLRLHTHITKMAESGWLKVDENIVTLTESGYAEMIRRFNNK